MVPWPPSKELEAKKCLGEGKNFASRGRRRARWHWPLWGAGHALGKLGVVDDHLGQTMGGP